MMVVVIVVMTVVIMMTVVMIMIVIVRIEEFRIERQDAVEVEGAAGRATVEAQYRNVRSCGRRHAG